MALVNMKNLLRDAKAAKTAVGAFNVGNMEMIIGAVKAAEELHQPIILQIAEKRLAHSPLNLMGPMMVSAAKASSIDIAVHLDHGTNLDLIQQALTLGFTSVMYDGSAYPLKENIEKTKEVLSLAARYHASVEGEIGVVGGNEGGEIDHVISYTDPEEAVIFAKETRVDALALSIGNAHGNYQTAPKLNFDLLKITCEKIDTPLVLHGGTGLSPADFQQAIRSGVHKINVATACFTGLTEGAESYFQQTQNPNYFGLNESMINGFYGKVKEHILLFQE